MSSEVNRLTSPLSLNLKRRGMSFILFVVLATLWWLLAGHSQTGIFGVYSAERFAFLLVASYGTFWGTYLLVSQTSLSTKVGRFALTSITILFLLGCLELPSAIGLLDYRKFFSPPESYLATNMKPWDNPANLLDKELMHIHPPGKTLVGETTGDLVRLLGIKPDRMYHVDLKFDSQGFRNERNYDRADIVMLGDSFLEGILVPQGDLVSSRLSRSLGIDVANRGQSGYGPQQELALLRRVAGDLKPKIVVWLFFEGNDLLDVPRYERFRRDWEKIKSSRDGFVARSFTRNVLFVLAGYTAPTNIDDNKARRSSCRLFNSEDRTNYNLYCVYENKPLTQEDLRHLETARNSILQAQEESTKIGAKLLLVYVPTKFRVYKDYCQFPEDGYEKHWQANPLPSLMSEWSKSNRVPFLDLTPALRERAAAGQLVYFTDDGHWNQKGHAVAADAIANFITGQGWLTKKVTLKSN